MGIVLWLASAFASFLLARIIPPGGSRWGGDLIASICGAALFGLIATALDFGGWREPDWRAAVFVFFGTLALLGCIRAFLVLRRQSG